MKGWFVFIDVHKCKKAQIWVGINIPFENVDVQWDTLKDDKCPMTKWSSFFNHLGVPEGTVENINNALNRVLLAMEEIIEFGVVSQK